jgi:hypothetical protein
VSTFKRASLAGSEELFRPTRPRVVATPESEATPQPSATMPPPAPQPASDLRQVRLSPAEFALILDAIQAAKYPERARRLPLEKFERYDILRDKLQIERDRA